MNSYDPLVTLLSALALGHSIFLSLWSLQKASGKHAYRFLGLLLLALAVRLLKSVILIFFPHAPYLVPAVGLVGMSTIGVFLWFHARALLETGFQWKRSDWLHFVPCLVIAAWQFVPPAEAVVFYQYAFAAAHMLGYMLLVAVGLYRNKSVAGVNRRWFGWLLGGMSVIWLVFFGQLFSDSRQVYVLITAAASLVLYGISFLALRQSATLFQLPAKPNEAWNAIGEQIGKLFMDERIFTDPALTVQKLAQRLETPVYSVSKAINQHFQKTFPELLAEYRIREAERLLCSPQYRHLSMEGIARECGFHSVSAFYAAFKNYHQRKPTRPNKRHSFGSLKIPF
ncbi:MAG: AraC family transcriptional regulator [Cytophagales bacterium]|nr:AraC family transcriptional regulator [Cytophagales bacterium]